MKALQGEQIEAERRNRELEKVNLKLAFDKEADDEVKKTMETQYAEYKAASDVTKKKQFETKLEEIKKAIGCEVIVTRVTGSERTKDLMGIHVLTTAQLKCNGSDQANVLYQKSSES